MPPRRTLKRPPHRFTVSLAADEYDALKAIAEGHRPPLSLRYVVEYALRSFLKQARDAEFIKKLGDPRGGANG